MAEAIATARAASTGVLKHAGIALQSKAEAFGTAEAEAVGSAGGALKGKAEAFEIAEAEAVGSASVSAS